MSSCHQRFMQISFTWGWIGAVEAVGGFDQGEARVTSGTAEKGNSGAEAMLKGPASQGAFAEVDWFSL